MPASIGLSGSGFLLFFLLGALVGLEDGGVLKRGPGVASPPSELTLFAGSSGGSILSLFSCLGTPYSTIYQESSRLADYCAAHNDCALSLDAELRRTLHDALRAATNQSAIAEAVVRCRGRVFINLSAFAAEKTARLAEDEQNPFSILRGRRHKGGRSRNTTDPRRRSNDNALSEIGLSYRPGAILCGAMSSSSNTSSKPGPRLALMAATQHLVPPGLGLGLHPEPWLVSDWRSPEDAIDAVAASSFNLLLSGLAPTTTFRGRPLVADGVYTVPLPVPPLDSSASSSRVIRISAVPDGYSLAPGSPPIAGADIAPGKRTGGSLLAGMTVEEWLCHSVVVADAPTRRAMFDLGRREAELFLRLR